MNKLITTIDDISDATWASWEKWFETCREESKHPTLHAALTALRTAASDTIKPVQMLRFIADNPSVLMLKTMFSADETVIDTIRVSLASHAEKHHRDAVKNAIKALNQSVLLARCRDLISTTATLIRIVNPGQIMSISGAEYALEKFSEEPLMYSDNLRISFMRMLVDLQLLSRKNEIIYQDKEIPAFLDEIRDINELISLDKAWFNAAMLECIEAEKNVSPPEGTS